MQQQLRQTQQLILQLSNVVQLLTISLSGNTQANTATLKYSAR